MFRLISSITGLIIGGFFMMTTAQAGSRTVAEMPRFQQVQTGQWIDRRLPSVEHPGQYLIVASKNGHAIGQHGQWLIRGQQVTGALWRRHHQRILSQRLVPDTSKRQTPQVVAPKQHRAHALRTASPVLLAAHKAQSKTDEATKIPAATPASEEAETPATSSQTPITDESLQSSAVAPAQAEGAAATSNDTSATEAETSAVPAKKSQEPTAVAKLPQTGEYHSLLRVSGVILMTLTISWWFISRRPVKA